MERSNDVVELLPEDIVFQILLLLPVKSLLRFKSVCKSWCSLIQSSRFVSQHRDNGSEESKNSVIVINPGNYHLFSLLYGNFQFEVSENLEYQYLEEKRNIRYGDIISCNGILCIQHRYWDISLWNPATRQLRLLPESKVPLPQLGQGHFIFHGFGFDNIRNDYKVVRFIFFSAASQIFNKLNQVEVYSLNTNSWTSFNCVLPIDFIYSDPRSPYLNGIYCWLGNFFENENEMFRIITFDFTSEVFGTIPLPNIQIDFPPVLAILRDKITIVHRVEFASQFDLYQIWVLNEYSVKESWTKLCTVGPFPMTQPIGFSKNGDLFFEKDLQQLCLCNLVTNELKNLPIVGLNGKFQVSVYKESLVSVQRERGIANVLA
ncbi:F-box/kelch-repeat protein [Thalictrum thalictroides]|uniref:F-box/kelch-repeat protein n=1 Tax=Thalictrum thalictroides TaxID=46969 RepID=A0A7J6WFQ0_THATH|nr:F-box/kelch-repeat protein [Thalictrum thalictroides]